MSTTKLLIIGIGGTTGGSSSTEFALCATLAAAAAFGAQTMLFGGDDLARLPHYNPKSPLRTPEEAKLVAYVRQASAPSLSPVPAITAAFPAW